MRKPGRGQILENRLVGPREVLGGGDRRVPAKGRGRTAPCRGRSGASWIWATPLTPARARGSSVRATPSLRPPRILKTSLFLQKGGPRKEPSQRTATALFYLIPCGDLQLSPREFYLSLITTLSRRNQIVAVPPLTRSYDGPIDLIVDSTGLKILGCGEWNAHKHKASKKRRDWRKLHIGVDAEGFIVAAELTASSRNDASTLPALLDTIEVPIRRFTADGAYDHRSVYDQLSAAGTENVVIVIPPRRSAVSAGPTDGPWAQRDTALERIRQVGRREWQKESGYRQQARVENSFFRYKSVLGGGLKARHGKAQRREVAIGCHILNRMAELGRPKSCAVVS